MNTQLKQANEVKTQFGISQLQFVVFPKSQAHINLEQWVQLLSESRRANGPQSNYRVANNAVRESKSLTPAIINSHTGTKVKLDEAQEAMAHLTVERWVQLLSESRRV